MPGHGRRAIVHNHKGECMVVMNCVNQTCDTGVEKGGVADEGRDLLF